MSITAGGERRAWELLAARAPADVCARSGASFDPGAGGFLVPCFGGRLAADPGTRRVEPLDPEGGRLLERLPLHLPLSLLWYLAKASGARPTGVLVRPSSLPGGDLFARGTHVLPLDRLAGRFGAAPAGLVAAAALLGGAPLPLGDAAVELRPFPHLPVTLILWGADAEFAARADLLLDRSAAGQLPVDILWSAAMMALLLLR